MNLPVVDLSKPDEEVAQHLVQAVIEHGFVYIKSEGSGISKDDVNEMFSLVCYCEPWLNTALT